VTDRLVVEELVPADPTAVHAAFTSADALARWWWPHLPDATYAVDGRTGGAYEIRSAAAGIGVRGDFVALDPPTSIRMTWIWLDEDREAEPEDVVIDFEPVAGGTLVRVTHECVANADDLRQGWIDVLARLARTF
jgi:uncharacterized protein YndB with AHSA1/START domain